MNQQWPPNDVPASADVEHVVRVVRTFHWRKGTQFYSRCACGWVGRKHAVHGNAEAGGQHHALRNGGRVEPEVSRG